MHSRRAAALECFGAISEGDFMLALLMSLILGRAYRWRPDIDISDSFVVSTLFADGGH
jgi:hypothetical protein